jgi:N-acetylmuramoyl-L-alanine amidase-like protein
MITRRRVLGLLAGVPALAAGQAFAATALIGRLIEQSRSLPHVSQRIEFISHALLGVRYQANTLIGGPRHPERFVVRDDAFDCVTFCEVVLAAAIVPDLGGFEDALRRIRYDHGAVQWDQRNHYFADWCQRNVDNGTCQFVAIEPSIVVDKTVTAERGLGKRQVSIRAVAKTTLLAHASDLAPGDIIGFTSRRADLDYFHAGLIAFGKDHNLLLRHASHSRGRVVEQPMAAFCAANLVRSVTLLRTVDKPSVAERL